MSRYSNTTDRGDFGSPRITWAVQRIILANVLIFAIQLLLDPIMLLLGFQGSGPAGMLNPWLGFQPDKLFHGWIWLPFTYQFLHAGLSHLFFNMLWLYFFGPDVERLLGTRAFFRFYIICGAGAVLATLIPFVLTEKEPLVVGASGAIMGVLVAFAMAEPDRQFFLFPIPFPLNARALVIVAFVMNIIYSQTAPSISWESHLGGMAMGFLYFKALPMFTAFQTKRRRDGVQRKKKSSDEVGDAVDNIFDFNDRNKR